MQIFAFTVLIFASAAWAFTTDIQGNGMETTTDKDMENTIGGGDSSFHGGYPRSVEPANSGSTPMPEGVMPCGTTGSGESYPSSFGPQHISSQPLPLLDPTPPSGYPGPTPLIGQNVYPMPSRPFHYHRYPPMARPFPFVAPPLPPTSTFDRFGFPGSQPDAARPMVIVKLLQPIILPVAKPIFPEGGDTDPEDSSDVDSERFSSLRSGRGHIFHRFGSKRYESEKFRMLGRPMPLRQDTFGPHKVSSGNGENIHISVKLH